MTIDEIKIVVRSCGRVFWCHKGYEVIHGRSGWYIKCHMNGHCIGLTDVTGTILNGNPEDFFVEQFVPKGDSQ